MTDVVTVTKDEERQLYDIQIKFESSVSVSFAMLEQCKDRMDRVAEMAAALIKHRIANELELELEQKLKDLKHGE